MHKTVIKDKPQMRESENQQMFKFLNTTSNRSASGRKHFSLNVEIQ